MGEFEVSEKDAHQCGFEGQEKYKYKVEITGLRSQVNKHTDFLIDNQEIDDYFQDDVQVASCEIMVSTAAKELKKRCIRAGFKPSKVVVEIIANDFASCVCELT